MHLAKDLERGFTYLGVLVAVAVMGIGLTAASEVWVTTAKRAKIAQVDWAGAQYSQAIGSYYEFSPGVGKSYPALIDELLEDRRGLVLRRHLRSAYRNPFAADGQWQWLRGPDSRIRGVRAEMPAGEMPRFRDYVYVRSSR